MAKILEQQLSETNPFDYAFYCPGCKCHHGIATTKHPKAKGRWAFNGDMDKPTVHPSVLVRTSPTDCCHLFIRNGQIKYLNDCTHELKGQTVDMQDE